MERTRAWIIGFGVMLGCQANVTPSCAPKITVGCEANDGECEVEAKQPAACPGPNRSGTTECFPSTCSAGQYCDDRGGLSSCRPGCTSDANCGPTEMCVRADGATVGRCEACSDDWRASAPTCRPSQRDGTTPCFPGRCAPGQYCVDHGLSHCEPGCVSDENCSPSEFCDRPEGSALGICHPCRTR